jgi:hypothetical protein
MGGRILGESCSLLHLLSGPPRFTKQGQNVGLDGHPGKFRGDFTRGKVDFAWGKVGGFVGLVSFALPLSSFLPVLGEGIDVGGTALEAQV